MRMNAHPTCFARTALAIALLAFSPGVFAYLDPSTGSMLVSAIVGILASLALAVKTYWYKLKNFFRREGKTRQDPDLKG
jgi:O-antigen/teichoic acid export membrane protein